MTIKAEDEAVKYTEKYYAETEAVDASKRVEYEKKKFFRKSAEKIKKVSFITITHNMSVSGVRMCMYFICIDVYELTIIILLNSIM